MLIIILNTITRKYTQKRGFMRAMAAASFSLEQRVIRKPLNGAEMNINVVKSVPSLEQVIIN